MSDIFTTPKKEKQPSNHKASRKKKIHKEYNIKKV